MDKEAIISVLEHIGAENVRPGSRNVQCSCFLSRWRAGHKSDQDSRPSMGILINPEGPSKVHCFACKYGGTFERALRDLAQRSGEDYSDLIAHVVEHEDVTPEIVVGQIPAYESYEERRGEQVLEEALLENIRGQAHRYLLDRGFDLETLKCWESGYDRAHKRAVFPVRGGSGDLVGAVGRTINGSQIKYFNYFGFDKSQYLFGEHKAKEGTKLVVVEGLLDTVKLWQAFRDQELLDEYSVVGILGSEASPNQCRKMVRFSDEVLLFFDNDETGKLCETSVARRLQRQVLLKTIEYPSGMGNDPDDVVDSGCSLRELFGAAKLIVAGRDRKWR